MLIGWISGGEKESESGRGESGVSRCAVYRGINHDYPYRDVGLMLGYKAQLTPLYNIFSPLIYIDPALSLAPS